MVTLGAPVLQLRLRLVPDGVVWHLLARTLDPVPGRRQEAVGVARAELVWGEPGGETAGQFGVELVR